MNEHERLIVGNLKMQWKNVEDMTAYLRAMQVVWSSIQSPDSSQASLVVCPSYPFLSAVRMGLPEDIAVGAQDVCWESVGAYTGEISASMLVSVGAQYVIVGHSERRQYLGEGDAMIAAKARMALAAGLSVVWCVGETESERAAGRTVEVLSEQVAWVGEAGLIEDGSRLVIAYEPRWAIGTDRVPTTEEIHQAIEAIRLCLNLHFPSGAASVRVLYGGSVNESNVEQVSIVAGADGVLVGRESLSPETLVAMYEKLALSCISIKQSHYDSQCQRTS